MTHWFNKKQNKSGDKYHSKSISISFHPKHFKLVRCKSNGAKKGIDSCYDLNIQFLGIFFSYTNWDYTTAI